MEELANKVGGSAAGLAKIEAGEAQPEEGVVKVIAGALGIGVDLLRLLGMERSDVAETKQHIYDAIFPAIENLGLYLVDEFPTS